MTRYFYIFAICYNMGKFLVTFSMLLSSNKEKMLINWYVGHSNELLPRIELHSNSCQYPLINYLATLLERTN